MTNPVVNGVQNLEGEATDNVTVKVVKAPEAMPQGTIVLDASTATSGINLEAFLRGGFLDGETGLGGIGMPVFDNNTAYTGPTPFAGEEMFLAYTSAASKYLLAHGSLEYFFGTHTIWGQINTIEYGTKGAGTFDGNGYFSGGNVELRITGLNFANARPTNPTEEAEIEANGAVHNFASGHMYGENGSQERLDRYANQLDQYAQHFKGSAYADVYIGTIFDDTIEGNGGNDLLTGAGGNDTIDGGAGTDTVVFNGVFGGPAASYSFTGGVGGAPLIITDSRADGSGIDTLTNVELLRFANLTYDFTIHRANYTPTAIALDDAIIEGSAAVGTVVGTLSVTDRDTAETHTLTLVDDAGGRFVLDGNQLKVAGTLTAEDYSVRVRVTDKAGNVFETNLSIDVTNPNTPPVITSNGGGETAAISTAENGVAVTTVTVTDAEGAAITYSISGADADLFEIDAATGALTFKEAPDYETPKDANGDNIYDVTVSAGDGVSTDSQAIAVTVTNVDEVPVISSNDGGATAAIQITEKTRAVTTVLASDPERNAIVYSIAGGLDAALFVIDAVTGVLTFRTAPDFNAPGDTGRDNVYNVTVRASDGTFVDTQDLAVTVVEAVGRKIIGTPGVDNLVGTPGDDVLNGRGAADTLIGGIGNDVYIVDSRGDKVVELVGEGVDLVRSTATHRLAANVENLTLSGDQAINGVGNALNNTIAGNAAANALVGGGGNDLLYGGAGDDWLDGGSGSDRLNGGAGIDILKGGAGSDVLIGGEGNDRLLGELGSDQLYGGDGVDVLDGGDGNDVLDGGSGNDRLVGGAGNDQLVGGLGADQLFGGAGADIFVFRSAGVSTVATASRDTIFDFDGVSGDRIDLRAIDANVRTAANDAFTLIGSEAFSKVAGELRYQQSAGDTFVLGDLNGDGKADFSIRFDAAISFTSGYFLL